MGKYVKRSVVVLAVIATLLAVGIAGNNDHDEYIEANLTKQSRMPYWYEN